MNSLKNIDFAAIAVNESYAIDFRCEAYKYVLRDRPAPLLSPGRANAKTRKTDHDTDWRVFTLALAHARTAANKEHPHVNLCHGATKSCIAHCVSTTGLSSVFSAIDESRRRKTLRFFDARELTLIQLIGEIEREHRKCLSFARAAFRLNCFSDVPWESPRWGAIPQIFGYENGPAAGCPVFYDYTAIASRARNVHRPANLFLTYSWKGPHTAETCWELLTAGHNVAVPFGTRTGNHAGSGAIRQPLPNTWRIPGFHDSFQVLDGDLDDRRFLDPVASGSSGQGLIVGLKFKAHSEKTRREGLETDFVVTDW